MNSTIPPPPPKREPNQNGNVNLSNTEANSNDSNSIRQVNSLVNKPTESLGSRRIMLENLNEGEGGFSLARMLDPIESSHIDLDAEAIRPSYVSSINNNEVNLVSNIQNKVEQSDIELATAKQIGVPPPINGRYLFDEQISDVDFDYLQKVVLDTAKKFSLRIKSPEIFYVIAIAFQQRLRYCIQEIINISKYRLDPLKDFSSLYKITSDPIQIMSFETQLKVEEDARLENEKRLMMFKRAQARVQFSKNTLPDNENLRLENEAAIAALNAGDLSQDFRSFKSSDQTKSSDKTIDDFSKPTIATNADIISDNSKKKNKKRGLAPPTSISSITQNKGDATETSSNINNASISDNSSKKSRLVGLSNSLKAKLQFLQSSGSKSISEKLIPHIMPLRKRHRPRILILSDGI